MNQPRHLFARTALATGLIGLLALTAAGCASPPEVVGPPRAETVYAVTDAAELIRFNAGQPQQLQARLPLQGLAAGDRLVGIDFRVSRGVLYALSAGGRLYTLDTATARLSPVGSAPPVALTGQHFGRRDLQVPLCLHHDGSELDFVRQHVGRHRVLPSQRRHQVPIATFALEHVEDLVEPRRRLPL